MSHYIVLSSTDAHIVVRSSAGMGNYSYLKLIPSSPEEGCGEIYSNGDLLYKRADDDFLYKITPDGELTWMYSSDFHKGEPLRPWRPAEDANDIVRIIWAWSLENKLLLP